MESLERVSDSRRSARVLMVDVAAPPLWLGEFDHVSAANPLGGGDQFSDVYLVDAREGDRVAVVASLVADAQTVLVMGDDDPESLNLYLELGAFDYLASRFSYEECVARVNVAARWTDERQRRSAPDAIQIGDVSISLAAHEVRRRGEPIRLTPHEFRLLAVLLRHVDETVSHRALAREVWDEAPRLAQQYLRMYVRNLRQKLEEHPEHPTLIVTDFGTGYRLQREHLRSEAATA